MYVFHFTDIPIRGSEERWEAAVVAPDWVTARHLIRDRLGYPIPTWTPVYYGEVQNWDGVAYILAMGPQIAPYGQPLPR